MAYSILLPFFLAVFPSQEACDEACEAVLEASLERVASVRMVPISRIVLQPPPTATNGAPAAHSSVLNSIGARRGFVIAPATQALLCSETPSPDRCVLRVGEVLVAINRPPVTKGDEAIVGIRHITYGPRGQGRVEDLFLTRAEGGWRVVRSEVRAVT